MKKDIQISTLIFLLSSGILTSCTKETAIRIAKNKLGSDTSYYNKFIPPVKLKDEVSFELRWILQKDTNLFIAKVDVPDPYSVHDILTVTALKVNADSLEIPLFDSISPQNLYYKIQDGDLYIYKYYMGSPPRNDWEDAETAVIAALLFIAERIGFFQISVKFNLN
jgi:hypothetical protein